MTSSDDTQWLNCIVGNVGSRITDDMHLLSLLGRFTLKVKGRGNLSQNQLLSFNPDISLKFNLKSLIVEPSTCSSPVFCPFPSVSIFDKQTSQFSRLVAPLLVV